MPDSNIALVFAEDRARDGDRPRLIGADGPRTAQQLGDRAARLAGALTDRGVAGGDRVLLLLANSPDVAVAYDAVARLGAVAVPLVPGVTAAQVTAVVGAAEAVAAVADGELGTLLPADLPRVVLGAPDDEAALDAATPVERIADVDAADPALIAFTSGTTGAPKGVVLTHGNIRAVLDQQRRALRYDDADVSLGVLPLAHLFGVVSLLSAAAYGYPMVLLPRFTVAGVLAAIGEHGVTAISVVPPMVQALLAADALDEADLSTLDHLVSGGAPLDPALAAAFEARTGARVLQGYGMTETAAGAVVDRQDEARRDDSCGRPYPDTEVVALDDEGTPLPAGTTGEIGIRGPQVTPGYWRDPDATAAAFTADGWLRTGDVGHVDADGFVFLTDRRADIILNAGENVYPSDVEAVLLAHPSVAHAAVVGEPDALRGERVVAHVIAAPDHDVDVRALRTHVRERMAAYQVPARIEVVDELPRNALGKVVRRHLRA